MVQCFKRKKTKKDVEAAKPKQEVKKKSSKGNALASRLGKLGSKKPLTREGKRKTNTPKKDIKSKPKVEKDKRYLFQLLVPVTTYVLSPCGKRKRQNDQIRPLKEKEVRTAIGISQKEVPHATKAVRKRKFNKFITAKAFDSLRNKTAISLGIRPVAAVKAQTDSDAVHLMIGETVGDYKVTSRLGAGGCGVVYQAMSKEGKYYAMKVERTNVDKSEQLLPLEAHILKRLQFSPYAAHFVQYGVCQGSEGGFRVLIMGLLGPSLNELLKQQLKRRFTIGTILKIGIQALRAVAFMHCIYFVHRDIKPSNFAVDETNHRRLYLFDFGLSRSIKTRGDTTMRRPRTDVPFRGTQAYCSLNAHKRMEHGRHDDLWSIFYMLVEFSTGFLPWQGKNRILTKLLKYKLMDFHYMFGCPIAFSTILNYLRSLDYYKRPDYVGIEEAFFRMLEARKLKWSLALDWEGVDRPNNLGVSVPYTSSDQE